MEFFIDPYKKYYDVLNEASDICSVSDSMISTVEESKQMISNFIQSANTSDWNEMGIKEMQESLIPNIKNNIDILKENINNALSAASKKAINELLTELKNLKTEDENYKNILTSLNNLVVPVSTSSSYESYLKNKANLDGLLNESQGKCISYKTKCDSLIQDIKNLANEIVKAQEPQQISSGDSNVSIVDYGANGDMLKVMIDAEEAYFVNTAINVFDYEQYILKNGIYQATGFKSDSCNLLSQNYAVDLLRGSYTNKSVFASSAVAPAVRMNNQVLSDNEDDILEYVYSEVTQGRPVPIQVTQKRTNEGLRHFVTVVGFKGKVNSYRDLTPDNMYVMDCYDGHVQLLSERNRRLYNQGKGYYALGATQEFLNKEVYNS